MAKRRSTRKKTSPPPPAVRPEVFGLLLLAMALLTVLSLLSASRGSFTEAWIAFLTRLVGWGRYVIPAIFFVLGMWFIQRFGAEDADERWEKPIGAVLLLFTLLAAFDFISPGGDPIATNQIGGGGALGWVLRQLIVSALDVTGAVVVLFFSLVLSVILLSGLSLRELAALLRDLFFHLRDWWQFRKLPINQPDAMPPAVSPSRQSVLERFKPLRREPKEEAMIINGETAPVRPAVEPSVAPSPPSVAAYEEGGRRRWRLPLIAEILDEQGEVEISEGEIRQRVRIIEETLASFGVEAKVREINQGPAVTQFSVEPGYMATRDAKGNPRKVRVSKIVNLANDLALALSAAPIRIEAPIPGRPYVGIEVPNVSKAIVSLRSALESPAFYAKSGILKIALGRNVAGHPVVVDLTAMPHLLIAGATGSGKSVCINAIVACLLCTHTPETLRLLMIDPKMVELVNYNGIPHLLAPVVTDLERVVGVLSWATREMDRRYKELSRAGVRNISSYNQKAARTGEEIMPYIVLIIDELADLMMMAPDDVERSVARIAQMARAVGIHLILATQRPSVDVVTGLIKANFPARIAFAVSSQVDSRVILDTPGAERLLGKGDMLYMAPDSAKLRRLQGVFVSDAELERLIKFWGGGQGPLRPSLGPVQPPGPLEQKALWDEFAPKRKEETDEEALLEKAIEVVKKHKRASISLLQRRLRIGYARAARLIDTLEAQGIIGPDPGGGRSREVLAGEEETGEEGENAEETGA
ncbi:MAG: DNA translocase FtsK [Caldilineae bacterium]|nr:MAG: DNA translocase FtsK [Caldilineae bacterium]